MKRLTCALLLLAACKAATPPSTSELNVPSTGTKPTAPGAKPCGDETSEPEDDPFGKTIAAVCIEGATIGGRQVVEKVVFLKPGARLVEAELRGTLESVHKTGILEDVAVYTRKLGAGVAVVLRVRERPRVGTVKLEGASAANVKAELAPGRTPLHAGEYYDPAYAFQRAGMLREMYVEEGFEDATVTPTVTKAAADGVVDVHMVIVEGTRSTVGKVTWVGVTKAFEPELKKASGLETGAPMGTALVNGLEHRIETAYYDRGQAMATARTEHGARASDGSVPWVVTVTEGAVFRLGKIFFTKNNADSANDPALLGQLQSRPGAVFSRSTILADIKLLQQIFAARGRDVDIRAITAVDRVKHLLVLELEVTDK